MRYIESRSSEERKSILSSVSSLDINQSELKFSLRLNFVGNEIKGDEAKKLEYIVSVWLQSMKYHCEKHKSKIIKKASKYIQKDKLGHVATFYETFG